MKSPFARLTLALLVLVLLACACVAPPLSDRLIFQVEVAENMSGELDISLQVRNAGQGVASARPEANAVMELRDAHNILRARADVVHLIAIDPGDILNPLVWRGRLDPGMYRLYWGAPGLGHTQVEFMLSQQDGRQRLEELRTMTTPDQDMPTLPTYGDAQPLVDLASVQLAGQLGVESGLIRVERVEPVDFPDASLGAPQPDMMYAQVITPGYVIELSHSPSSSTATVSRLCLCRPRTLAGRPRAASPSSPCRWTASKLRHAGAAPCPMEPAWAASCGPAASWRPGGLPMSARRLTAAPGSWSCPWALARLPLRWIPTCSTCCGLFCRAAPTSSRSSPSTWPGRRRRIIRKESCHDPGT